MMTSCPNRVTDYVDTFGRTAKKWYSRYMAHWIMIGRGLSLALIALGGFIAVMNWATVIATRLTGRFHSAVPLIGAVLLAAGLALLPRTRHYAWAAVLADYGTLILLFSLPGWCARRGRRADTTW